jgi:hypothetical protein
MRSKKAKYRIKVKVWEAADVKTSYLYNLQIYTGKHQGSATEKNLGHCVVCDLMEPVWNWKRCDYGQFFHLRANCRNFAAEEYYYDRNIESKKG